MSLNFTQIGKENKFVSLKTYWVFPFQRIFYNLKWWIISLNIFEYQVLLRDFSCRNLYALSILRLSMQLRPVGTFPPQINIVTHFLKNISISILMNSFGRNNNFRWQCIDGLIWPLYEIYNSVFWFLQTNKYWDISFPFSFLCVCGQHKLISHLASQLILHVLGFIKKVSWVLFLSCQYITTRNSCNKNILVWIIVFL